MRLNIFWKLIWLEEIPIPNPAIQVPKVSAVVLEGSVLVNLVKQRKNQKFESCTFDEFKSRGAASKKVQSSTNWHSLWHFNKSLWKRQQGRNRAKGSHQSIQDDSIAPPYRFLRLGQNKTELFRFLIQSLATNYYQKNFPTNFCFLNRVNTK